MMKKNLVALALVVCMLFVCIVCAQAEIVASGECGAQGNNVTWTLDDEGNLVISGSGMMKNYTTYSTLSPWYKDSRIRNVQIGKGVTSIGEWAFYDCSSLTTITIPEGVTGIGHRVFYGCSSLTGITIPESVTSIGVSAFDGCSGLTAITIPEGVTSIGWDMFHGCSSLTAITIPEGVTSIGGRAFSGCSSLTTIRIPDGVTRIESETFRGCSSLTTITIPESVTSIGDSAFDGCSSLTAITIPEGVTNIGQSVFYGCNCLKTITIPEGVKSIESHAFYDCGSLTKITIPESVTSIGSYAFEGCNSLTAITIPEGVTSIKSRTFYGCSSLTAITIPEGVTSIGEWAFYGCSSLTAITIPESVTSISSYAFYGCSSLAAITIPESVTSIGNYAFSGCSSLTAITIPESMMSIGDYAFYGCRVSEFDLPDNLENIGYGALNNVKNVFCTPHTQTAEAVSSFCVRGYEGFSLRERDHVITVQSYSGSKELVFIPEIVDKWSGSSSVRLTNIVFPNTLDEFSTFDLYAENATFLNGTTDLSGVTLRNVKKIIIPSDAQKMPNLIGNTKPTIYCYMESPAELWALMNEYEIVYLDNGLECSVQYIGEALNLDIGEKRSIELKDVIISPVPSDYQGVLEISCPGMNVEGKTISASKAGDYTLTITLDGHETTVSVHVNPGIEDFTLKAATFVAKGREFTVSVENVVPQDIDGRITWKLNGETVESVTGMTCTFTAQQNGEMEITAIAPSGVTKTVRVLVPEEISSPNLLSKAVCIGDYVSIAVDLDGKTFVNEPTTYGEITINNTYSAYLTNENGKIRAIKAGRAVFSVKGLDGEAKIFAVNIVDLSALSSLVVPSGTRRIDEEAFAGVAAECVVIPEGCTSIGSRAFADSNVKYVMLSHGTQIQADTFDGCSAEILYR